jgi:hypothetical protein
VVSVEVSEKSHFEHAVMGAHAYAIHLPEEVRLVHAVKELPAHEESDHPAMSLGLVLHEKVRRNVYGDYGDYYTQGVCGSWFRTM